MFYSLLFLSLFFSGSSIEKINKIVLEYHRHLINYSEIDTTETLPLIRFSYQEISGIGLELGVSRRDPSDIIMVDDKYYIWYSKVRNKPGVYNYPSGYSATVWYATSPDGINWIERGQALGKGIPGSWDDEGVYTPNILVANNKYYLTYDGSDQPWTAEKKRLREWR